MTAVAPTPSIAWSPQPGSQVLFVSCPVAEALYDGTRGPGKTDALLMSFAQYVGRGFGHAWRGILFRQSYKQLDDVVARTREKFARVFPGARFTENDYEWHWPTGEALLLRYMDHPRDYWNYHGHEYPWIGWEELTNWPDNACYEAMRSTNRSSHAGVPRMIRSTANPYGVGHHWVKFEWVDQAPPGRPFADGRRVRLWGHWSENKILLAADPEYAERLAADNDPNRRKAWLNGDWDVIAGGMFGDVWDRSVHVLRPFAIPSSWRIDRAFDWGIAKPFSVGWWAESDGTEAIMADNTRRSFPPGTLFRIDEWYGWDGRPNHGCGMQDIEIARGIVKREEEAGLKARVKVGVADGSIFDEVNGDSPAKQQAKGGVTWRPADKSPGSRARGWSVLRDRLAASRKPRMEEPGLFVFDTCTHFIRTVPALPRHETKPDDINTDAEDHVADETRYRILRVRGDYREHHAPLGT